MTETIKLSTRLAAEDGLDLRALNSALRAGRAQLDWSATREASPEALRLLLTGLDLAAAADALGLDTVPDDLADPVAEALDGNAPAREPDHGKRPKSDGRGTGKAPAVWTAPEDEAPEQAGATPDNGAATP